MGAFPIRLGGRLRLGHLDGKGNIYDSKGELMLQKSEVLLGRYVSVDLDIKNSWRISMTKSVFAGEAGLVTCYLTDRRIVCIRRPDVFKAGAYLMTPVGAADGISKMHKAKMILRNDGYEYFEVVPDDIRFYKKYPAGVNILILAGGKKYGAGLITKDKAVSPKLHTALMSWLESKGIPQR